LRTRIHNRLTLSWRLFCRRSALNFLAIRQAILQPAKKALQFSLLYDIIAAKPPPRRKGGRVSFSEAAAALSAVKGKITSLRFSERGGRRLKTALQRVVWFVLERPWRQGGQSAVTGL